MKFKVLVSQHKRRKGMLNFRDATDLGKRWFSIEPQVGDIICLDNKFYLVENRLIFDGDSLPTLDCSATGQELP